MNSWSPIDDVKSSNTIKLFVLSIVFLNALGAGVLIPVVPRLVQELTGRGPESASFENGLLLSVYAATAFLLSPFLGRLSDRLGRRPVLLLATVGSLLDYALCAVAHSFAILLIARVLAGVFGASTSVASAALVDITPAENRASTFGLSSAVIGLGLILGPVLGGVCMEFGIRMPFVVACVLAACELGFGLIWFPETLQSKSPRGISLADVNPLSSIKRLLDLPFSKHVLVSITLFQFGGTIGQSVLVLFAQAKFGWNGIQVGALMTTLACTSVIIRSAGIRLALSLLGENASIVVGLSMFAAAAFALAFVNEGWQVYVALVFGQCGTIAVPVMLGQLSRVVAPEMQGEAMGGIQSVMAVAVIAAPLIGAFAFGGFGVPETAFGGEWVFILSGLIDLLAIVAVVWGSLQRARVDTMAPNSVECANKAD